MVDLNGTLIRNSGAASALRISTGTYQVIFNRDVTGCSHQATLGGPTTTNPNGEISAAQRTAVAAGVQVVTRASNGTVTNNGFQVAVFC